MRKHIFNAGPCKLPDSTLENVSKYYKNKRRSGSGNRYEVGVENINLTIGQGEFVFITGSSGAGKSTLLGLISGRLKPDRGRVLLDGVNVGHMTTNLGGKLSFSVELEKAEDVAVEIVKA